MADHRERARCTPAATVGPFYPGAFVEHMPGDLWEVSPLVAHHPQGEPIVFVARFLDALKRPVPSLVVEVWQANAVGRYRHPEDKTAAPLDPQFDGFARLRTSDEGMVRLRTIKPGPHAVPGSPGAVRAPHLRLTIFASGIDRLATQVFFAGEALNDSDPLLRSLPSQSLRDRLIAKRRTAAASEYELDIVLRGEDETPFFEP
jgi:protocatechuate 3,4-dioxygenase beta subunit